VTVLAPNGGAAHRLAAFFAPVSIALVGASDNSGWSRSTYENLRRGEFPGRIYCVNSHQARVHGRKTYSDLSSIPERVDLAYVLVGTERVLSVMAEAAELGIRNLEVVAAGYAEVGPAGRRRQRQLRDFAVQHDQMVLGPNNLGFINSAAKVVAFSQPIAWPILRGGVSLLSQSGALAGSAMDFFLARDIGVSSVITLGNEAVINVSDGMEYLIDDPNTNVIALFIEAIRDPTSFRRAAARALKAGKPVVVCRIGRGEVGARAVAAHTGALMTDEKIVDAAFRQLGVIGVDSIEDLIVTSGLLDSYGVIKGDRLGCVTQSGGMCGVISDLAEREGLRLPSFSRGTVKKLRAILPPFATPQNPLDVTGYVVTDPDMPRKARELVIEDDNVDVVLVISRLPRNQAELIPLLDTLLRGIAESAKNAKAQVILSTFFQIDYTEFTRRCRAELGLHLVLPGVQKALPALARAIWWSQLHLSSRSFDEFASNEKTLPKAAAEPEPWSEVRARGHLEDAGVPVVPGELVHDAPGAVAAAERLGYPVVLKAVSPGLLHKTDLGAVALNLTDTESVRDAFGVVTAAAQVSGPHLEGVLVAAMRQGGVELFVGVMRDPSWGPVLAVGMGGIWVEAMHDVTQRLLPVPSSEIRAMLNELKGNRILHGDRGGNPVDFDVVAEVISKICDAARSLGDNLDTLEVNPIWVSGAEVEVLDAVVTWRRRSPRRRRS
jgi:acyl-CoA synthetase (NDP forming)